jgi:hypothetical protein
LVRVGNFPEFHVLEVPARFQRSRAKRVLVPSPKTFFCRKWRCLLLLRSENKTFHDEHRKKWVRDNSTCCVDLKRIWTNDVWLCQKTPLRITRRVDCFASGRAAGQKAETEKSGESGRVAQAAVATVRV